MTPQRIGFCPPSEKGWMGGVNYFVNLFKAVETHSGGRYRCVAFVSSSCPKELKDEYGAYADVVSTSVLERLKPAWIAKHLLRIMGLDIWRWMAKRYKIAVFSHLFNPMRPGVPTYAWIPDFQHVWLPSMFSARELRKRDWMFHSLIQACDGVVLSSESARRDCIRFAGRDSRKFHVLHFVVQRQVALPDAEFRTQTVQGYSLPSRFFHVPNQLWAHKNHRVVFEAVALLKSRGVDICVVCTGGMEDARNPDHVESLQSYVRDNGLENSIRMLGLIGYKEMVAIMGESLALINPSRFEGWSTTVEESKSLGIPIVLSSIPVHVEQAPPGGQYFDPDDSATLAAILEKIWKEGAPVLPVRESSSSADPFQDFYARFAAILEKGKA